MPGTMMFGEWGTKDPDESIRIIHRALDAGLPQPVAHPLLGAVVSAWLPPASH
jgi:hypothetical protein